MRNIKRVMSNKPLDQKKIIIKILLISMGFVEYGTDAIVSDLLKELLCFNGVDFVCEWVIHIRFNVFSGQKRNVSSSILWRAH
jgi:hypothetical protein